MYYLCTRKKGFRSSVGLEQRPSKAWVLGSSPNGITGKCNHLSDGCIFILILQKQWRKQANRGV